MTFLVFNCNGEKARQVRQDKKVRQVRQERQVKRVRQVRQVWQGAGARWQARRQGLTRSVKEACVGADRGLVSAPTGARRKVLADRGSATGVRRKVLADRGSPTGARRQGLADRGSPTGARRQGLADRGSQDQWKRCASAPTWNLKLWPQTLEERGLRWRRRPLSANGRRKLSNLSWALFYLL